MWINRKIKVGNAYIYKHFQRHIVTVVCIATHIETREDIVVYKDQKGKVWASSPSAFLSNYGIIKKNK